MSANNLRATCETCGVRLTHEAQMERGTCDMDCHETRIRRAWQARRDEMLACPRCVKARAEVVATGLTLSDAPNHGEHFCAANSVEHCGPATFGHPKSLVVVRA